MRRVFDVLDLTTYIADHFLPVNCLMANENKDSEVHLLTALDVPVLLSVKVSVKGYDHDYLKAR